MKNPNNIKTLFLTCICFFACCNAVLAQPVRVIMDFYPPFSYEENGEIKGISTQVVMAVFAKIGIDITIKQYPFARAYAITQNETDVFEYCVVRTPEREKLFQWVGVVGPSIQSLFALKSSNIRIEKIQDLKKYKIGTVFEDVVDQYLRRYEKNLGLTLDRVYDYELDMNKLLMKRLDIVGMNKFVALYLTERLGYSKNDIEEIYTIEELKGEYYLVTGLTTTSDIVEKVRLGFEIINKNGTYQKIIDEYFSKNKE